MFNWQCGDELIRALWDLDPSITFLNHGSYGAVPRDVQRTQQDIMREIERNPVDFLSRRLPEKLACQRTRLAQWLNMDADGCAFVSNATAGVGSVLTSLSFKAGDEIVFHSHGYGWVRQALQNLSKRSGVKIREAQIPWPTQYRQESKIEQKLSEDIILEAFDRELSPLTKLVICDHMTSPTALILPVRKIVQMARVKGIPILVDGAHAPGLVALDLQQIDADFYTGNLHKWVCAPRGAAFLAVKSQWRDLLRPESLSYSGGVTHHAYDQSFAGYFDWTGTRDYSAWLSIGSALDFNEKLNWGELFQKRNALLSQARARIAEALKLEQSTLPESQFCAAMGTLEWPLLENIKPDSGLARELSCELLEKHKVEVPVICMIGEG
ncbi:aminotransferase class V-fold PLP-dependent enzyme [bacterium]|nr:aminotransferase class V-fold PLP-dependent enzyme [bacterium]